MARAQKSKASKKSQKVPFLLRRLSVPVGLAVAAMLAPIAFAFAVLTLNSLIEEPTPITYTQEKAIRDKLAETFKSKTVDSTCTGQTTAEAQHNFEYQNIRINRTGDRAIIRYCNNSGLLLAKTSNDIWFSVSSIDPRPEGAQDYKTRLVCKVEDITLGFDDMFPENQAYLKQIQNDCRDIDATYTRLLEEAKKK